MAISGFLIESHRHPPQHWKQSGFLIRRLVITSIFSESDFFDFYVVVLAVGEGCHIRNKKDRKYNRIVSGIFLLIVQLQLLSVQCVTRQTFLVYVTIGKTAQHLNTCHNSLIHTLHFPLFTQTQLLLPSDIALHWTAKLEMHSVPSDVWN